MHSMFLLLVFVMAVVFFFGALSSNLRQEKTAGVNVAAPQLKDGPWLFWGAVAGVTFISCMSALSLGLTFWEARKAITLGLVFAFVGGRLAAGWDTGFPATNGF